ncbi:MAG: sensor histidine kinase [Clostridia bacterium]|nr:sensor histidine kinase [Clostridia bacterium]
MPNNISININFVMFAIELLVAELIFLYSFPKRKFFYFVYPLVLITIIGISLFWPSLTGLIPIKQVRELTSFFGLFLIAFGGMFLCFKASPLVVFSACCAGYGAAHIAAHITSLLSMTGMYGEIDFILGSKRATREFITFPFIYAVELLLFGLPARNIGMYKNYDIKNNLLSVIIIVICIGITSLFSGASLDINPTIGISIYAIISCTFAIMLQTRIYAYNMVKNENKLIKYMIEKQKKYYQDSQHNINILNQKAHDLKHHLTRYKEFIPSDEFDSMSKVIDTYNIDFDTGYAVLDIILKEKALLCSEKNITITFLGNGEALNFINDSDAYALFGNIIDNAIEAVSKITDIEKRLISITSEDKKGFCIIKCSNYFEGAIIINGKLPETTKDNTLGEHGFGLKSIKTIAEKYNGDMIIEAEENIFTITILLLKQK